MNSPVSDTGPLLERTLAIRVRDKEKPSRPADVRGCLCFRELAMYARRVPVWNTSRDYVTNMFR